MTACGKDQRTGVVTRVRRAGLCGRSTPRKGVLVPRPKSRHEHISIQQGIWRPWGAGHSCPAQAVTTWNPLKTLRTFKNTPIRVLIILLSV